MKLIQRNSSSISFNYLKQYLKYTESTEMLLNVF